VIPERKKGSSEDKPYHQRYSGRALPDSALSRFPLVRGADDLSIGGAPEPRRRFVASWATPGSTVPRRRAALAFFGLKPPPA